MILRDIEKVQVRQTNRKKERVKRKGLFLNRQPHFSEEKKDREKNDIYKIIKLYQF